MRLMSLPANRSKNLVLFLCAIFSFFISCPFGLNAQTLFGNSISNRSLQLERELGLQSYAIDSSAANHGEVTDSSGIKSDQRSPLAAVLLSMVIPGGGQVYNGSYWKVPIIIGVQAFFVSQWISNNKLYQSYRSQFADSLAAGPPYNLSSYQRQYNLSALQGTRDGYRDQRDSYAWYIAGAYLLSMLDAYVDAELSGFDVSPNLTSTPLNGATVAIAFRLKF